MPKNDLNQSAILPPPEKEAEQIPDIREAIPAVSTRLKLSKLIEQQYILGQQEAEARNKRKPITDEIKKILGENEVGKLQCNDYRVNYFATPRATLSKELLLQNGVSPRIIALCTKVSTSYTLRITTGDEDDES